MKRNLDEPTPEEDLRILSDFLMAYRYRGSSTVACAEGRFVCVPQFNTEAALHHATTYGVQSMRWQDVHRDLICSAKPIVFDSLTVGHIISEALEAIAAARNE